MISAFSMPLVRDEIRLRSHDSAVSQAGVAICVNTEIRETVQIFEVSVMAGGLTSRIFFGSVWKRAYNEGR